MTATQAPIAGVILSPNETSHMPEIFEHWLDATGLPGRYVPLWIEPDNLSDILFALPKAGFAGVHIAPGYQRAVLDIADIVSDRAALMNGGNTLIFRADGKLHADNTDGYGFIENIRQTAPGWNPKSGPVAIFGAGRAARVVITALTEVGVDEIRLSARSRPRAEELKREFGMRVEVTDWMKAGNITEGASVVVNATPLGSDGFADFRVPLDGIRPGTIACELVFDPPHTRFKEQAYQYGAHVSDGIGMMLCQAAPSFERWFGKRPPIDDAARAAAVHA